jgi:AcrR family transcriptional regulator
MERTIKERIIATTFKLIAEKGYATMTTKEIAKLANVNETTIFRNFETKKGIILTALKEMQLFPELTEDLLSRCTWSLEKDLRMFADIFMSHVTNDYAKVIIGLQDPQIFPEIRKIAQRLPNSLKTVLAEYFSQMHSKGKISDESPTTLAEMFMSLNFGFVFSKTAYKNGLIASDSAKFINAYIRVFTSGIGTFER